MDFLDRLIDYIEDNITLSTAMVTGSLNQARQSIAIRPTPSSMGNRFMNKDTTREYSFQILIKDPNQIKANSTLHDIASLLDGLGNNAIPSDNDSYQFINCKVYVLPNHVETTAHNEYIYTAMFTAELQGGI